MDIGKDILKNVCGVCKNFFEILELWDCSFSNFFCCCKKISLPAWHTFGSFLFFFYSLLVRSLFSIIVYQYLLLFLFLSFVLVTSQIVFFYKISNLSINFITTSNFEIICTLCAYIQFRKQLLNTFIYILLCC